MFHLASQTKGQIQAARQVSFSHLLYLPPPGPPGPLAPHALNTSTFSGLDGDQVQPLVVHTLVLHHEHLQDQLLVHQGQLSPGQVYLLLQLPRGLTFTSGCWPPIPSTRDHTRTPLVRLQAHNNSSKYTFLTQMSAVSAPAALLKGKPPTLHV